MIMKKTKDKLGFSLIEILAAVVIIAILALIITPTAFRLVQKSRYNSFKTTIYGIIESADLFISSESYNKNKELKFVCDGNNCKLEDGRNLDVSGKPPESGSVDINDGKIKVNKIEKDGYCALGTKDDLDIKKNCDMLDATDAIFNIDDSNIRTTTNSIILDLTVTDLESGIKKIEYYINGKLDYTIEYDNYFLTDSTKKNTTMVTPNHVYPGLTSGETYIIKVVVTNGNNRVSEVSKEVRIPEVKNPSIDIKNIPEMEQNGYYKSQSVDIKFDNTSITNPEYYIKSTREVSIKDVNLKACGNSFLPSTCDSEENQVLKPNTWYKVTGNISIVYNDISTKTDTLYALTYDGVNYSGASTATLSKIDRTIDELYLGTPKITKKTLTVPITFNDKQSGVGIVTSCKIGSINGVINGTTSCRFDNLDENTTYTYEVCVRDLVGNTKCVTDTTTTGKMTVEVLGSCNPTEQNGYCNNQVVTANFSKSNITDGGYYIKSTKTGKITSMSLQACGDGNVPGSCSSTENVTNLIAGTWYRLVNTSSISVTYDEARDTNASFYAGLYDGDYYVTGSTFTLSKVDRGIDILSIGNIVKTKNSLTLPIIFSDSKSGIDKITSCKIGSTNGVISGTTSCRFDGLKENTSYTYEVCGKDLVGNSKCVTGTSKTGTMSVAITGSCNPTEQNGYCNNQVITANFSSNNITSGGFYVKATAGGTIPSTALQVCGNDVNPSSCSSTTNITNLQAGYWYKLVSTPSISVTFDGATDTNASFYAGLYDGESYVTSATFTLSKVDRQLDTLLLGSAVTSRNSLTIPVTIKDSKSGIGSITSCKIGSINGVATGATSCKISGLKENTSYTYEICGSDAVGNTKCETGTATTGLMTGTITLTSSEPASEQNGYYKSQTLTANFSKVNVTNGAFYIKSTRNGTIPTTNLQTCGTGTTPSSCGVTTSINTLQAGYWYKLTNTSSLQATFNGESSTNAYFYSLTYDGEIYVTSDTYTLSKIDTSTPTLVNINPQAINSGRVDVTVSANDTGSGIAKYVISYGESATSLTGSTTINSSSTTATTTLNLQAGKTYYFKVTAYDKVGNYAESSITSGIHTCTWSTTYYSSCNGYKTTTDYTTYTTTVNTSWDMGYSESVVYATAVCSYSSEIMVSQATSLQTYAETVPISTSCKWAGDIRYTYDCVAIAETRWITMTNVYDYTYTALRPVHCVKPVSTSSIWLGMGGTSFVTSYMQPVSTGSYCTYSKTYSSTSVCR